MEMQKDKNGTAYVQLATKNTNAASDAEKRGATFCQYACTAVKNRISTAKEKDSLEDKNAGMKISDDVQKKIKKIRQLEKHYIQFGIMDEKKRIVKIANALEMTEEDVLRYRNFDSANATSLEQTNCQPNDNEIYGEVMVIKRT